jgi:hypothetical protein
LEEVTKAVTEALQTTGATSHVKALQAVQLAMAIHAVGVFFDLRGPVARRFGV